MGMTCCTKHLVITTASGLEMVLEATEAAFPGHSRSLQQKGHKICAVKSMTKKNKSQSTTEYDQSVSSPKLPRLPITKVT